VNEAGDLEALREAVRAAHERCFRAGESVYEEGDEAKSLFTLCSGEVELRRRGSEGPRAVMRVRAGEVFGEFDAFAGHRRISQALAVVDSRALEIDTALCEALCKERPMLALHLLRQLAEHAVLLQHRLAQLDVVEPRVLIARLLLHRAGHREGTAQIATNLRELARETGISLFQTYLGLHGLLAENLVRMRGEGLVVPQLEALARSAERAG